MFPDQAYPSKGAQLFAWEGEGNIILFFATVILKTITMGNQLN